MSTPAIRKERGAKPPPKATTKCEAKVNVHDGVGVRNVTVSISENYYNMLARIATIMKRSPAAVELRYEAPWSMKAGTKKLLSYLSNETEWAEFWVAINRYVEKPVKVRKGLQSTSTVSCSSA